MGQNSADVTTVKVKKDTWKQLNALKEPGDSFNDVIANLLDEDECGENPRPTTTD